MHIYYGIKPKNATFKVLTFIYDFISSDIFCDVLPTHLKSTWESLLS